MDILLYPGPERLMERRDHSSRVDDGVGAQLRRALVRGPPLDDNFITIHSLVSDDQVELGCLAHHGPRGLYPVAHQSCCTQVTLLLGSHGAQCHRPFEWNVSRANRRQCAGHGRQPALHICRPSSPHLTILNGGIEGRKGH